MKIEVNGMSGIDFLRIGIQTNVENIEQCQHFKAKAWAPKKAKSYTIINVLHTDYHGKPSEQPTGYGYFDVSYFTTTKEGKHSLAS